MGGRPGRCGLLPLEIGLLPRRHAAGTSVCAVGLLGRRKTGLLGRRPPGAARCPTPLPRWFSTAPVLAVGGLSIVFRRSAGRLEPIVLRRRETVSVGRSIASADRVGGQKGSSAAAHARA